MRSEQESAVRESRTLRLTWRGLETWPWWNCEPNPQSKERDWKPSTYSRRACPRPYLNGGREETCRKVTRLAPTHQGVGNRPFYRWLTRDYRPLFPRLPERTRLFRLLKTHQDWTRA